MSLLDAVGTFVGGGGLASAVGTVVSAVTKYKERKLEMSHEKAMAPHREKEWAFEVSMAKRQAEHDRWMAEQGLLVEVERGSVALTQAAIQADANEAVVALSNANMPWWVAAIRTLFRPFLTIVLWSLVFILFLMSVEGSPYRDQIVAAVTNGAGLSLGIWFGGRISRYKREAT